MTKVNDTKLAEELKAIMDPAFKIRALLQGAMALLDEFTGTDPAGDVWSARELIEQAGGQAAEIYGDRRDALQVRLEKLDEVAA